MSLERFLAALTSAQVWHKVRGDHVDFRCPLPEHEDRKASASADWSPPSGDRPGRVLLVCHPCGAGRNREIVEALGLLGQDLFDDDPARPPASSPRAGRRSASRPPARRPSTPAAPRVDKSASPPAKLPDRLAASYPFVDTEGRELARLRRYETLTPNPETGKPDKRFAWRHRPTPDAGYRKGKPEGVLVPLYRLPEVLTAAAAGSTVWVTEGCKNADDLLSAGVLAATSAPDGAATEWRPEFTDTLRGARLVVVVADRDAPGYRFAGRAAAQLEAAGLTVRLVRTPLEQHKADASDHLAAGLQLAAFEPVPAEVLAAAAAPALADAPPVSDLTRERRRRRQDGDERRGERGRTFRRTDYGNAERLIHHHGRDLLNHRGQWYVWDGTRYRLDQTGGVERLAKKTVRSIWLEAKNSAEAEEPDTAKKLGQHAADSESRARLSAMVSLAASELPVVVDEADDLDSDPWLLNCRNGTIDLRAGQLRPHDRADRITRCTGVVADLAATAPTWDAFLARILPDPAAREFMQRIVGYTLTGLTSEEKLFILNGGGANGKSTLIDAVMMVLGEYGMPAPPDLLLSKRPGAPSNDVAALRGARLASAAETEDGARLDEVRTKSLVTGDRQSARFLHKEFFTFKPAAKYWIATNHRPIVRGSDEAIWRRMVLVPFEAFIPPAERDKTLAAKLRVEAPGILAWAVRGCLAWQRDGLTEPAGIQDATAGYRAEQDLIGGFLEDACVMHSNARVPATALYNAYRSWCEATGENAQTQRRFGQRLSERPGLHKAKSGTVTWYGLGLRAGGAWDHLETSDPAGTASAAAEKPAEALTLIPEGDGPTVLPAHAHPVPAGSISSMKRDVSPAPCAVCADLTAVWCGFGDVADERLPCLACGKPTATRAACGAVRHGNCRRDQDLPAPPGPAPDSPPAPAASSARRQLRPVADTAERIDPAAELARFGKAVRARYPDATEDALREGLVVWLEATDGTRFVSYPGEVGIAAYARLVARHGSMVVPSPVDGAALDGIKVRLGNDYLTPKLTFPPDCWVTGLDINAQYLAAARSVEVGDGEPVTGSRNPVGLVLGNAPGYVRMRISVNTRRLGLGDRGAGKLAKGEWITTQTAKYLIKDRGLELPISEIVYWPEHGRRLSAWSALFAGAYRQLKPREKDDLPARYALFAVKAVYTTFLNGMLRSGRYNHTALRRPDWSDQVRTLAHVNQFRALDKAQTAGHVPIGVYRDAAWFASSDSGPFCPPGLVEEAASPGKWKVDRHAAMDDRMRAAYDSGSVGAFRKALAAACGIEDDSDDSDAL